MMARFGRDEVSIHAPPRGARQNRSRRDWPQSRFNPRAPTRGATSNAGPKRGWPVFQSTRPHEGRDQIHTAEEGADLVSIHAPPRGARRRAGGKRGRRGRFNPRAPTRGATVGLNLINANFWFQSTRPHEGRDLGSRSTVLGVRCFNPRAPTRGATTSLKFSVSIVKFQSTRPHEGRDLRRRTHKKPSRSFNPRAPTRGATAQS